MFSIYLLLFVVVDVIFLNCIQSIPLDCFQLRFNFVSKLRLNFHFLFNLSNYFSSLLLNLPPPPFFWSQLYYSTQQHLLCTSIISSFYSTGTYVYAIAFVNNANFFSLLRSTLRSVKPFAMCT